MRIQFEVPHEICKTVTKENCVKVPRQKCETQPKEICKEVTQHYSFNHPQPQEIIFGPLFGVITTMVNYHVEKGGEGAL